MLLENGSDNFYWKYVKSTDAYIGSEESIEFIDKFMKKYYENNKEFHTLG